VTLAERKIAAWLSARGYRLRSGQSYSVHDRTVEYRPSDPAATRVIFLLHECGHVLYARNEPQHTGYNDPRGRARSKASAADLVRDEIEAWHRGYALAGRLRIRVDPRAYRRAYGHSVMSYVHVLGARAL
jgi:hypothetical protein